MTTITAHYFDGRSARPQPASLDVEGGLLRIATDAHTREVPVAAVRLAEPFASAPAVLRLDDGASCEVAAGPQRQVLLDAIGYRKSRVERWQERWPLSLLSLVLLVGLLALLYFRGLPLLAERIAAALPPSVDVRIGRVALSTLEAQTILQPSKLSDERIADVQALLPRVLPAHPRIPVRVLVRASPMMGANAMALPDGTIVVTDALVRQLMNEDNELDDDGKDQLVAVLGHEVGHLEHRHTTRALAGSSLVAALSATLFGDFSAVAAGVPALLVKMSYSREMELDADDYAVGVLRRNGLPPSLLADALEALQAAHAKDPQLPGWMRQAASYASTHPDTAQRIARLQAARR